MTWTNGGKAHLNAAAARNPGGSWAIGLSNYTSNAFPEFDQFHRDNNGYAAQTFSVVVRVPELAKARTLRFFVRRSNSGVNDVPEGEAVMHFGTAVVPAVGPLDLITLRSEGGGKNENGK